MSDSKSRGNPRIFYGYIVVLTGLVLMLAMWGSRLAFGVFFNPLLIEFGWSRAMLSGAFSLSILVEGMATMLMGGLTDKLGPRIVLTICGVFLGAGYLLMSLTHATWQLYIFYGLIIGIGMSGSFIPILTTVSRWFVTRRNTMIGIVLCGTGLGSLIAAPAAERLIATYDWRFSYIVTGGLVLVVMVIFAQFLRRDPAGMGLVPHGEAHGEENMRSEGLTLKEAVSTRQFQLYFCMLICFGFAMFSLLVHLVPHAIALGITPAGAASIMAALGALTMAGRILLGGVADKIGNRWIFISGFASAAVVLLWLVPAREIWMLYIIAGIFGFVQGGMGVSEAPFVARLFGLKSHGLIFGVSGFGFTIGASAGPFLTGYIFDVTGSYQLAFIINAVFAIIALALILSIKPIGYRAAKLAIKL